MDDFLLTRILAALVFAYSCTLGHGIEFSWLVAPVKSTYSLAVGTLQPDGQGSLLVFTGAASVPEFQRVAELSAGTVQGLMVTLSFDNPVFTPHW